MLSFDHIAIATTDLPGGSDWLADRLGVSPQPGGRHERYGTHNMLLGMGDLYLELIAPDPDAAPTGRATWFGLDHFAGPPRPANWICRTGDLDAAIADAPKAIGRAVPLTRGDLHWRITVPDDGSLPLDGAWPTLIQWGADVILPAKALPDSGCRLIRWQVQHPDAAWLSHHLPLDDPRVTFASGPPGFRATIATPRGEVEL